MELRSFLGPLTAATVAGAQPMGSVFSGVPSSYYLRGRDLPRALPSAWNRSTASTPDQKLRLSVNALPCGCGA
jgi:hypothetical protein